MAQFDRSQLAAARKRLESNQDGRNPQANVLNHPMPYEVENKELFKTLKWVWGEMRKVYAADDLAPIIYLIRDALDAGDVTAAIHTLGAHCCHSDLVPASPGALKNVRTPIPELQPVLNQLERLQATWAKAIAA